LDFAGTYMVRGDITSARKVVDDALSGGSDIYFFHIVKLLEADSRGDTRAAANESQWATGKPSEYSLRWHEATLAAAHGQLRRARDLFESSIQAATRVRRTDGTADVQASLALVEALEGDRARAVSLGRTAFTSASGSETL